MKEQGKGERSSLERVRSFLADLENGDARPQDAEKIRDDLYELVSRVERVQNLYPDGQEPELSPDVCRLLKRLGKKNILRRFPFMKAASFL